MTHFPLIFSLFLLGSAGVLSEYLGICPYYSNAGNSYSATESYYSCYFPACPGDNLVIGSCGTVRSDATCSGDQFLRLFDGGDTYATEVAYDDDGCGRCSQITYTVPAWAPCKNYYIREGCYSISSCSGRVEVSIMNRPSVRPTAAPITTAAPTVKPSSAAPTVKPSTAAPTVKPSTAAPTVKPSTAAPTVAPTLPPDFQHVELFAVLDGSSCAETLYYGPQAVSQAGSADGVHPSFLSTSTRSRNVPHRYWQQVVTSNGGQELFRVYWTFSVERTLAGHFAAAVREGVLVTYTVLLPSGQRYAYTGTWRFSSSSGITGGTFDTTSTACCFSADDGAWGAGSGAIDAHGNANGFAPASFWGIGNWDSSDSGCSNVYMNGVRSNAQAYGAKTFMYYTGAPPPTIAPSAAPTLSPDFQYVELFAVLSGSSCAETLYYGPQAVSQAGSADGAHPSFLSTSTQSRDVSHRYWQQVVTSNGGQELFRVYWTFSVERTLAGHFAAAVREGVLVTYTVLLPSGQRYAYTGTWWFSSNSGITGGTFDTTSTTCCFSADDGAWGAGPGAIDAHGNANGFAPASFWGIGNWEGDDSDCSNVYMNGVQNNAQAYGAKTFMYYTGAQPPTIAPSAAPTTSPSTITPTTSPTTAPTIVSTREPTRAPTKEPIASPTRAPTFEPTEIPTREPTLRPTRAPTFEPTEIPTRPPTLRPTPTQRPSELPTPRPTPTPQPVAPTVAPTLPPDFQRVELFAVLDGSSCAETLYYGPQAVSRAGSADGAHPSFLSTSTKSRDVSHRYWQQVVTYNGGQELFRVYWTFSVERTLAGHFAAAVREGVLVTYTVLLPSGQRYAYSGTWWFSSSSGITGGTFDTTIIRCCFSADDGAWGAGPGAIDGSGNASGFASASFWGIGNWEGDDSDCSNVYMNGFQNDAQAYGLKTFMYYTGAQPPTVAPSAAPTAPPSTHTPTKLPTAAPTTAPTRAPTCAPTRTPTKEPTARPTRKPTFEPTEIPTRPPTLRPTPTPRPSAPPTPAPTAMPTAAPTIGDVELFAVLGGSACAEALYYGPSAITLFGSVDGLHPYFLSTGTLGRNVPHKHWLQVVTSNGVTELFRVYWTFSVERTLVGHISTAASSGVAVTFLVMTPSGERFTHRGSWWFSSASRITSRMFEAGTVACCLSANDGVWGAGSGGIDAGGNSYAVAPSFWGIGNWNGEDASECRKIFMNGVAHDYGGNTKTFMYYRGVQPPSESPTPASTAEPPQRPTVEPSKRWTPSPTSPVVEQPVKIQVAQEIYGVDFDACGEDFTSVIKRSIADCIDGATPDSIFDFYVTAGPDDGAPARRLRGEDPVMGAEELVGEAASPRRQSEDKIAAGSARSGNDAPREGIPSNASAAGASAVTERPHLHLRSHAQFRTASSSVVAHYGIALTSGWTCEGALEAITSAVRSGQFETALHTRAAEAGVPELTQASAGTITTSAAECPDDGSIESDGGRSSGGGSTLSAGAVAGIVLAVIATVGGLCYCCICRPRKPELNRTVGIGLADVEVADVVPDGRFRNAQPVSRAAAYAVPVRDSPRSGAGLPIATVAGVSM